MEQTVRTTVVAGFAALALSGCWLQPGADAEKSSSNRFESAITPSNVAQLHVGWTKTVGGSVNEPAVTLDGVYVATGDPDAGTITLLARDDGAVRWTTPLSPAMSGLGSGPPSLRGTTVHVPRPSISAIVQSSIATFDAKTGMALAPLGERTGEVAVRGDLLIGTEAQANSSFIAVSSLFVNDTAGTQSWNTLLDFGSASGFPIPTSVAIGPDRFFFGRGPALQAFLTARPASCPTVSGRPLCPPLWNTPTTAPVAGHPVLSPDGSTVYGATGTKLLSLTSSTGALNWSGTLASAASAAPALGNGFIYVPTIGGELDVFADSGCGQVTCPPLWTASTGAAINRPPTVVAGGIVYTASSGGVFRAYPAAGCGAPTCNYLWSARVGSTITGGPVAAFGSVYIGTADGRVIAYRA